MELELIRGQAKQSKAKQKQQQQQQQQTSLHNKAEKGNRQSCCFLPEVDEIGTDEKDVQQKQQQQVDRRRRFNDDDDEEENFVNQTNFEAIAQSKQKIF